MKRYAIAALTALLITGCVSESDMDEYIADNPELFPPLPCDGVTQGASVPDDFLCAHNIVRDEVSPAAEPPLTFMGWDANLATLAQAYAEGCSFEHNADRSADYFTQSGIDIYLGENLYLSTATEVTPYDAVLSWADEAQFYDYSTNSCASGEECGHYTQLVWRDSLQVGCGSALCSSVANSSLSNATLVVCNYAPGGNYVGVSPY